MTKEIIINKVDVSKCKYFGGFDTECLKQDLMLSCDEHPNCKYKQIKRQQYYLELEKKADKYKQALNRIEDVTDDYNRVEKTSQYYRDGFDEIQDIIENIKES